MNPDLRAFLAAWDTELVFGQILIVRRGGAFELRHELDRAVNVENLKLLKGTELRVWAQTTAAGAFRPLRSAPTLRMGWWAVAANPAAFEMALHYIYPGALPDWFAAQSNSPPVTSYRAFMQRQTGMYRITTSLDDAIAGAAIRACCAADFCLKRRLWTVEGLGADEPAGKSIIPCLEPCAIMLEFARKIARLEQNVVKDTVKENPAETDFDAPNNPRRAKFVLERQALAGKSSLE